MTLTYGTAPLGPNPAGALNFERPRAVMYWEDYGKRFRVEIGGETLADTRGAKTLHETGQLMRVYVPQADARMDRLGKSERRYRCPRKGDATYWSFSNGGESRDDVAWSYDQPIEGAPPMANYLSFDLEKVDAWYLEDERGYAHPRDPYHRVDMLRSSRRVVARLGGEVVAETNNPAILFETSVPPRYYFAPDTVRRDLLEKSETVSDCPYKGPGQHWRLSVGSERVEDAAWSLPEPIGEATGFKDWVCFYPGKVATEVDGERLPGD